MHKEFIQIGNFARPHGVKGEVELNITDEIAESLKKGTKLFLNPDKFLTIESVRIGNKVLVYFKEVTNRNFWEEMKYPQEILLLKKDLPKLQNGECYVFELVGLKLINVAGEFEGEVLNHYSNGAQIVLELMLTGGARQDLPYIKPFFPEFNLEEGWLRFIKPEYTE